jgi:hypothetical protein
LTGRRRLLWLVLAALLSAPLGCCAGYLLNRVHSGGALARWVSLGTPPGRAAELVRVCPDWEERAVDVYAQSSSGTVFHLSTDGKGDWQETVPPECADSLVFDCEVPPSATVNSWLGHIPEAVVDCARMEWSWEWTVDETYVVVLADGSVWWWHHYSGPDTMIAFVCAGSLLAGLVGGAAAACSAVRRRPTPSGDALQA